MAGCSTPEYRAARDTCAAQWLRKTPPECETRETTLVRHEDVPDGTETCTAERIRDASDPERVVHTTKRTCAPNTKRVEVPCLALETADVRKSARDAGTRACTARFCLAGHGNVSCGSEERGAWHFSCRLGADPPDRPFSSRFAGQDGFGAVGDVELPRAFLDGGPETHDAVVARGWSASIMQQTCIRQWRSSNSPASRAAARPK